MRRLLVPLTAVLTLAVYESVAQAQWVRVAPGSVQAPFVRVEIFPDGTRHVRAPFVNIYTPPLYRPFVPNYEALTVEQRYHRQVFLAAAELHQALRRFDTGTNWQTYFQLTPGAVFAFDHAYAGILSVEQVQGALRKFDDLQGKSEFSMITGLPAFQNMRTKLADYLSYLTRPLPNAEELPVPTPAPAPVVDSARQP